MDPHFEGILREAKERDITLRQSLRERSRWCLKVRLHAAVRHGGAAGREQIREDPEQDQLYLPDGGGIDWIERTACSSQRPTEPG